MKKCRHCNQEIDEDDDAQPCGWPAEKDGPNGYPPCWDDSPPSSCEHDTTVETRE